MAVSPANWMGQTWSTIGPKTLSAISLPGSHDSGVSVLTRGTSMSNSCNTQTQSIPIAKQLALGCRYFDLRPVIWGGVWYVGHFGPVPIPTLGMQGSVGEQLQAVLTGVAKFASAVASAQELVILKFSHYFDHDSGKPFTPSQIAQLISMVQTTLGAHLITSANPCVRLGELTLEQLIGGGRSVLAVLEDAAEGLAVPATGFYSFGPSGGSQVVSYLPPAIAIGANDYVNVAHCVPWSNQNGRLRFLTSQDNGQTWSTSYNVNNDYTPMAPSLAVDLNGHIYMLYVAAKGSGQLLLTISTDGGQTWGNDIQVGTCATSMAPSLAIDSQNRLYAVYVSNDGKKQLLYTASTNLGVTWSAPISIVGDTTNTPPALASTGTGDLYVLYVAANKSNALLLTYSYDHGKTWSQDVDIPNASSPVAPALAASGLGTLYGAYANTAGGVSFISSVNDGQTWTQPQAIPLASAGPTAALLDTPPALACSWNGTLFLVVQLVIPRGSQTTRQLYFMTSVNHGASWTGPAPLKSTANLAVFDQYANSNNAKTVAADQNQKFANFQSDNGSLFLLSWTATATPQYPGYDCISQLAAQLNPMLPGNLQSLTQSGQITSQKKPNILYVDYYGTPSTTPNLVTAATTLNSL
ncbi:MAG TPA: exo-alpha-sialidase [Caulobacteraceae bacterium]|jgi:hypothetical protein